MSDKTLDDLILTDPEPEQGKSKGILFLLGLVVLLIVVGAILAKMIFSSPEDSNSTTKADVEKSVQTAPVNEVKENSSNNNTNSTTTGAEDPELSPLNDNGMPANVDTVTLDEKNDNKNVNSSQNDSKGKVESPVDTKNIPDSVKEHNKKVMDAIAHKNSNKNSENRVITHEKKAVTKSKTEHKTVSKPKIKHTVYGGAGNVYIQVGSFAKGPDNSFINKILKAHFKYRIKEVNGYRRVLVGPFRSSTEAQKYLGTVKAKISQNAFIKK